MSTNTPTPPPEPAASAKPPRNPVERLIVWGGILVMLAVMLVELRAQQGYSRSLQAISTAVDGDKELKLSELKGLLAFSPNVSAPVPVSGEINDEVQCSWLSLFKSGQYVINLKVSRGDQAEVLSYSTPSAPEEAVETPAVTSNSSTPSPQSMGGGMGMGMGGGGMGMGGFGGGGGGGQRRPNPLRDAIDANADGDLSSSEIADSHNSLTKLDKDTDGQIVASELTPPPAEGSAGGGAPGSGGPPAGGPGGGAGGPPGGGAPGGGPGGGGRRFPNRLLEAIDSNADGSISTEERTAAPESLKKLDADGDGQIVRDELRPPGGFGGGGGPGGGFGPPGGGGFGPPGGGGEGRSGRRQRPDAEEPAAPTPAASGSPPAADTPAPAADGANATPPAAETKAP